MSLRHTIKRQLADLGVFQPERLSIVRIAETERAIHRQHAGLRPPTNAQNKGKITPDVCEALH